MNKVEALFKLRDSVFMIKETAETVNKSDFMDPFPDCFRVVNPYPASRRPKITYVKWCCK